MPTDHFHDNSSFVELLNNTFRVDSAWINDVIQLKQYLSICEVAVQTIHARHHSHTVHPVTICCKIQTVFYATTAAQTNKSFVECQVKQQLTRLLLTDSYDIN